METIINPNIKIGNYGNGCFLSSITDDINMIFKKDALKNFTDDDVQQLIIDAITHEYMHYLLREYFGITICKLYDVIEENFRKDKMLIEKYFSNVGMSTWKEAIKKYGFNHFMDRYNITKGDINYANRIVNKR